jgi:predicted aspartyl protease
MNRTVSSVSMKRRRVGTFTIDGQVTSIRNPKKFLPVPDMLVDSGSGFTWVPDAILRKLHVHVEKKDLVFQMADGRTITRSIGFAVVAAGGFWTVDEVVFGQPGDLAILGARTLEGFGARVDPRNKCLVASGPHLAALAHG